MANWSAAAVALPVLLFASGALAGDLAVTTSPGAPPGPVRLILPPGQNTGTFTLFLQNTAAAKVENAVLVAFVQDAASQPAPAAALEFLAPGADKPASSWTVPAHGQVRLLLRVSNLPQPGVFTGSILWQKDGSAEAVAPLTLERPPAPRIKVQQADSNRVIKLAASKGQFNFTLTLTELSDQADVSDLRIALGPLTRSDGASGLAARWSLGGEMPMPLVVKRHDNLAVVLAGELPERTVYGGWLSLRYGDQLDLYTVQLSRTAGDGIIALEAADGKVLLQVAGQRFDRVLTLQTAGSQPEITDLQVSLDPLRRQDGKPVRGASLSWTPKADAPLKLRPGELLPITLTGEKLEPVAYVSNLRLQYQGRIQPLPVVITRAPLLQNLSVDDPGTMAATSWLPGPFSSWLPCTGGAAGVTVAIHETSGQETALYNPRLGSLQLVDQKGGILSVGGEQVRLQRRQPTGVLDNVGTASSAETRDIVGSGEETFVFQIGGLPAGSYRGKVVAAGPDSNAVAKDFTITVRDLVVWPFLVVLLGVGASWFLYGWMRDGRYRDQRSADIARSREQLVKTDLPPAPDPVRGDLLARLDRLQERNRFENAITTEIVTATLNDVGKRAQIYRQGLDARRRVEGLLATYPTSPPDLAARKTDEELRLANTFQSLQTALLSPEGQGFGDADAPHWVKALVAQFDDIRADAISYPAEALRGAVDELIQESPELTVEAGHVRDAVDAVITAVGQKQFDHLADKLQEARRRYAELRVAQLTGLTNRLPEERRAAPEAHPDAWSAVDRYLREATRHLGAAQTAGTVEQILAECELAGNSYLRALIEHLDVLTSPQGRPASIPPGDWTAVLAGVPGLRMRLGWARQEWDDGQYAAAQLYYKEARDQYRVVLVAVFKHDVIQLTALLQTKPAFVTAEDWKLQLAQEPLKPILDQLAGLPATLPKTDVASAVWQAGIQGAWSQFLGAQLSGLTAGYDRLQAQYESVKNNDKNRQHRLWTETIPQGLEDLKIGLEQANAARDAYTAAPTQPALLLDAQVAFGVVRARYKTLLQALGQQEAKNYAEASQLVNRIASLARPAAQVPPGPPNAHAAALSAPAQGSLYPVPQFTAPVDRSAAEWYKRIEKRDRIAQWIVLLLGTLSGVAAVWLPNATFGSLQDYITAFLWGFGFHSAANGFLTIATSTGMLPDH